MQYFQYPSRALILIVDWGLILLIYINDIVMHLMM